MKITCLLVDDEPIALTILSDYVQRTGVLEVAGRCHTAVEAFAMLQRKPVDLLFLDIQMPQLSGLDLLRTLPHPPPTIITSAYREYALDGYELDVLDYLIKPIPFERFMKAVGKVLSHKQTPPTTNPIIEQEPFLFVREDRKLVRINYRDILSLESQRDYVQITTVSRQVMTRQTIGYYEELLPGEQFVRIHRSFIVAVDKIEAITESHIHLPSQRLAIGRYYKQQVFERLQVRHLIRGAGC